MSKKLAIGNIKVAKELKHLLTIFDIISCQIFCYIPVNEVFLSLIRIDRSTAINIKSILIKFLTDTNQGTKIYKFKNPFFLSISINHIVKSIKKSEDLAKYLVRACFKSAFKHKKVLNNFNVLQAAEHYEFMPYQISTSGLATRMINITRNNQLYLTLVFMKLAEKVESENGFIFRHSDHTVDHRSFYNSLNTIFLGTNFSYPLRLWDYFMNFSDAEISIKKKNGIYYIQLNVPKNMELRIIMTDVGDHQYIKFLASLIQYEPLKFISEWFFKCDEPLIFPAHPSLNLPILPILS